MPDSESRRNRFHGNYVLLLTLVISVVFLTMIWPFVVALLIAAIGAGMLQPVYRFFRKLYRGREAPASITTIFLLLILILGPLSAFLGIVVTQAVEVSQTAIPWVKENVGSEGDMVEMERWITEKIPALKGMMPDRSQLGQGLADVAQSVGNFLVASVSKMTAGTAAFFLNLFVMLYAMFFFLISGRALLEKMFTYSPLPQEEEEQLVARFLSVTRATLKGSLIIGIIQGALGGIGFHFAGIQGAAFWATIMAILSVIPGAGTAVVWIPAVAYLYIKGDMLPATLLLAWCAGVVGTIDNVLRPRLVGKDAEMPDLLILLGTLGGLFLFGAVGFIVGPIVCSLFLAIWEIYGATFKDSLPPVTPVTENQEE